MTFYHRKKFLDEAKNVFQKILIQDAKQFPIKSSNNKNHITYNKVISLTNTIISTLKKQNEKKTEHEIKVLQRQIDAAEKQIDKLVYELYGLTEDEIKIVESS